MAHPRGGPFHEFVSELHDDAHQREIVAPLRHESDAESQSLPRTRRFDRLTSEDNLAREPPAGAVDRFEERRLPAPFAADEGSDHSPIKAQIETVHDGHVAISA